MKNLICYLLSRWFITREEHNLEIQADRKALAEAGAKLSELRGQLALRSVEIKLAHEELSLCSVGTIGRDNRVMTLRQRIKQLAGRFDYPVLMCKECGQEHTLDCNGNFRATHQTQKVSSSILSKSTISA